MKETIELDIRFEGLKNIFTAMQELIMSENPKAFKLNLTIESLNTNSKNPANRTFTYHGSFKYDSNNKESSDFFTKDQSWPLIQFINSCKLGVEK